MLENDSAENGTGGNDAVETLPTNAPTAPPIPTSPAAGAPAARPAPEAPAQAPPLTPGPAAPSRSFMGALAHALIGSTMATAARGVKALAGPPPVDSYSTDSSGKMTANYRQEHTSDRLSRLAMHALEGLAAGSQVGPQRSAGAAWGAGIGAGASAVRQQGEQQDLLKRKQAQDDFEEQQRTTLHKATVAMTNAQTHSYWQKIEDDENAKDTERQKNMGIVNDLNDYVTQNPKSGLTVQTLTAEQAMAMHEADAHTVAKHTFLPVGKTQAKDANGNDVFEADGATPKFVKQFAAIGGSADSKVGLPQGMVDDLQKYSKFDPRLKGAAQMTAGQEVPLSSFLSAYKFLTEDKGKEADGGKEGEPVTVNGKIQKRNKYTGEISEYAGGVPLSVQKQQADIAEKKSVETKNLADAAKLKKEADAEGFFNPAASSGLTGDDYLESLPPAAQNVLKAIAEGRETRSPRQLQDKNGNPTPLAEALHKAYPDFDDKKAAAYGAVVKDFTSGNTSRALTSYGTAINHARALYDNTGPNSYIPGTDEYKRYNQDITYVATEVAKALNPTGVATESAIKEQEDALRSITNRKAAIENAEHILSGKMSEVKQRWANAQVRPSYQPPMPSLSKEALDNAEYIRNQGSYQVTDPNGKAHKFPDQASADKFKKLAGIE